MADYSVRTVTTTRKEYILPSPSDWGEVGKVMAAIRNQLSDKDARYDDTVTVEARDDEIVFSYTVSEGAVPHA